MDEGRFEQLSKSLATSVSRRQAVKIAGVAALGGMISLVGARGAWARQCRQAGQNCRSNAECCTRFCDTTFHCACPSGSVLCNEECVPADNPPKLLNPQTCACECDASITCPPPRILNPQTCQCQCPAGTTACGQTACCGPNQICQKGTCVNAIVCGGQLCDPARCCTTIFGQQCCSPNQVCTAFGCA